MRPRLPLALLALPLLLSGCLLAHKKPVHVSSDPPGARVLLNGRDIGFSTPCLLDLPRKKSVLALELEGYRGTERELVPYSNVDTTYWREWSVEYRTWRFPLWLNRDDLFTPWRRDRSLGPNRIHVRLARLADEE